jgi:hypothetical protein
MSVKLIHCECGICNHGIDLECIKKECQCCFNFHVRSGK